MAVRQSARTIKAFPDINLRALARRVPDEPLLNNDRFYFYSSGRAAVYAAARLLTKGAARTVHMPSYHCGVEVEGFLRAGFTVCFYPVDSTLIIDVSQFAESPWKPGDIVVVIHYFGFSQPIEQLVAFCRKNDLTLVEDCAHSLYTKAGRQHLGRFGDLSVFSMRKTIALPNGGGLLLNNPELATPEPAIKRWVPSLIKGSMRSVLEYEEQRGSLFALPARAILKGHRRARQALEDRESETSEHTPDFYDDPRYDYELALSPLSRLLLQPMPVSDIRALRCRNYRLLSDRLASRTDLRPAFSSLDKGTVPLCFPVWVDSSDRWTRQLYGKGVEVFVFGRRPHPLLSANLSDRGEPLRSSLLGLPVHQDLTEDDIQELADRVCRIHRNE